tara:strand:- start:6115 stop:6825 length:711 start_codon:yes stop_codon:yes gene_type:complete
MTLAELLASIQAGQAAGLGETGARLSITAEGERRDIQKATKELRERFRKAGEQAKKREKRRGVGRLVGGTAGFLLGGAGGRAIGSAIGQQLAAGGDRIGRVSSGLGGGMFFQGAREDVESSQRDINRFISDANRGFTSKVLTSAVTDYLGGLRAQQMGITPESLKDLGGATLEGIRTGGLGEGLGTIQDYFQSFKPGAFGSSSSLLDYSYGSKGIGAKPFVSDLSDYGVTVTGIRG